MTTYKSGRTHQDLQTVRLYVKGEATSYNDRFFFVEPSVGEAREPEAPVDPVETPRTEETLPDETTHGDEAAPHPVVEKQPFSAPQMEWDAMQYVYYVH